MFYVYLLSHVIFFFFFFFFFFFSVLNEFGNAHSAARMSENPSPYIVKRIRELLTKQIESSACLYVLFVCCCFFVCFFFLFFFLFFFFFVFFFVVFFFFYTTCVWPELYYKIKLCSVLFNFNRGSPKGYFY